MVIASGPPAASSCHLSASFEPTTGTLCTQEGGGDNPCVARFFTSSTPSDADWTSTPIARPNGTMKIASMTIVSSAVATDLRPPAQRSAQSSNGHVAMTMVVAQISAPRNGNSVHRLPAIKQRDDEDHQEDPREIRSGYLLHVVASLHACDALITRGVIHPPSAIAANTRAIPVMRKLRPTSQGLLSV